MRKVILIIFFLLFFITQPVFAFTPTHKFTDQLQDRESRLYYYGNRYYDPQIGRFIQPDPLQNFLVTPELEKRSGMLLEEILADPQRLNAYSYAENNPINITDPTGEVSEERQERFDKISDYIINDENYWLIRDRDGNQYALDAIWNKCKGLAADEEGNLDVGDALDTFYDAVHIDWAHGNTLDKSEDDFWERYNNLPSAIGGIYGSDKSNIDKLQHFVTSAKLTYKYGPYIAGFLGRLKEIKDGIRALFHPDFTYNELKSMDEGYSRGDITANQVGIFWMNEYEAGGINPSDVINNLY